MLFDEERFAFVGLSLPRQGVGDGYAIERNWCAAASPLLLRMLRLLPPALAPATLVPTPTPHTRLAPPLVSPPPPAFARALALVPPLLVHAGRRSRGWSRKQVGHEEVDLVDGTRVPLTTPLVDSGIERVTALLGDASGGHHYAV